MPIALTDRLRNLIPLPHAFLRPTFLNTTNKKKERITSSDSLGNLQRNHRNEILTWRPRLLANRYDPAVQPGLIIDQVPAPGEEVAVGYSVGVTVSRRDLAGPGP